MRPGLHRASLGLTLGICAVACGARTDLRASVADPDLPPPRPIAPLSTATATSWRPTFRWELAPGIDGARVELCADRACTVVLDTLDVRGDRTAPTLELPPGVVFWRLYGRRGALVGARASPTWELFLGARSAIDTSFGSVVDVDGDGLADVLDLGARALHVFYGASIGARDTPDASVELPPGPDRRPYQHPPSSAGDVDGDGFGDVLVVARSERREYAFVFRGGPLGLEPEPYVVPVGEPRRAQAAAAGDVNGDGYADLVVGLTDDCAPRVCTAAYLYFGGAEGLSPGRRLMLDHADDPALLLVGYKVTGAGDLDGDGYGDFAVLNCRDLFGGSVEIFHGGPDVEGTDATLRYGSGVRRDADFVFRYVYVGQNCGNVASVGDFDGDGLADLALGAGPHDEDHPGHALVVLGSPTGVSRSPRLTLAPAWGLDELDGFIEHAGDVEGDGLNDLLVPRVRFDGVDGIDLYRGGPGAAVLHPTVGLEIDSAFERPGSFGDLDGDGRADVVIRTLGPAPRLRVHMGRAHGLDATPTFILRAH